MYSQKDTIWYNQPPVDATRREPACPHTCFTDRTDKKTLSGN